LRRFEHLEQLLLVSAEATTEESHDVLDAGDVESPNVQVVRHHHKRGARLLAVQVVNFHPGIEVRRVLVCARRGVVSCVANEQTIPVVDGNGHAVLHQAGLAEATTEVGGRLGREPELFERGMGGVKVPELEAEGRVDGALRVLLVGPAVDDGRVRPGGRLRRLGHSDVEPARDEAGGLGKRNRFALGHEVEDIASALATKAVVSVLRRRDVEGTRTVRPVEGAGTAEAVFLGCQPRK